MRDAVALALALLALMPTARAQEAAPPVPAPPLWLASFPPFAVVPVFPPQVVWPVPPMFFLPNAPVGGWPLPFPFPAFLLQQAPGAATGGTPSVAPGAETPAVPAVVGLSAPGAAAEPGEPRAAAQPSLAPLPATTSPQATPPRAVPASQGVTAEPPAEHVPVAVPLPRLEPPPGAGGVSVKTSTTAARQAPGRRAETTRKPAASASAPTGAAKPAKRRLCWKNGMVDACP